MRVPRPWRARGPLRRRGRPVAAALFGRERAREVEARPGSSWFLNVYPSGVPRMARNWAVGEAFSSSSETSWPPCGKLHFPSSYVIVPWNCETTYRPRSPEPATGCLYPTTTRTDSQQHRHARVGEGRRRGGHRHRLPGERVAPQCPAREEHQQVGCSSSCLCSLCLLSRAPDPLCRASRPGRVQPVSTSRHRVHHQERR